MSFVVRDGFMFCEQTKVADVLERVGDSPFYLYSLAALTRNYRRWVDALEPIASEVCYAVKANANLTILKHLQELGSSAVLVSGNELRLALAAGFKPAKLIFNGNGKTLDELVLAVERGVRLNIDSEFDLDHIENAAAVVGRSVDVLVRVNPDIDPDVHPYVSTGVRISKFGIREPDLDALLQRIRDSALLKLVGVHTHLGSTITDVSVFAEAAQCLARVIATARAGGHEPRFLNLGGGLGIDYERTNDVSNPQRMVEAVRGLIPDGIRLTVEPGRSIVGEAGILVARVIGVKNTEARRFIVVDASMSELLRPSLYNAYHEIGFVAPVAGDLQTFDIVGPVCESADFLGKDRRLPTPGEGMGVAVYDAGAYGYVMSSNYNARSRPAEYMVSGKELTCIRRRETLDDHLRLFDRGPAA